MSPNGVSYIGVSKQKLGEAAACAVKRTNLDMRVAKRAQRSGNYRWPDSFYDEALVNRKDRLYVNNTVSANSSISGHLDYPLQVLT